MTHGNYTEELKMLIVSCPSFFVRVSAQSWQSCHHRQWCESCCVSIAPLLHRLGTVVCYLALSVTAAAKQKFSKQLSAKLSVQWENKTWVISMFFLMNQYKCKVTAGRASYRLFYCCARQTRMFFCFHPKALSLQVKLTRMPWAS